MNTSSIKICIYLKRSPTHTYSDHFYALEMNILFKQGKINIVLPPKFKRVG